MKLVRDETAGSGKERYVLHIGRDEIRLLNGILTSAHMHTPRITETLRFVNQINQMRREFTKALKS